MIKHQEIKSKWVVCVGDILIILIAINLSIALRLRPVFVPVAYTGATVFMLIGYLVCFYIFGLYDLRTKYNDEGFLPRYFTAVLSGALTATVLFYVFGHWKVGRGVVAIATFFVGSFSLAWRMAVQRYFLPRMPKKRVLIIGAGDTRQLIHNVLRKGDLYEIVGSIDPDMSKAEAVSPAEEFPGSYDLMPVMAAKREMDVVITALEREAGDEMINALLEVRKKGISVYDAETVYESMTGKVLIGYHGNDLVCSGKAFINEKNIYAVKIKRLFSVIMSLFLVLITFPIAVSTALLVKLGSRGPVFYRQKRVGLNGKIFELIKFRSMVEEAEKNGPVWAEDNDPRTTRFGGILRKLHIDEIPQLINVIKGDMSLIGPRPERPEFVESLQRAMPFYTIRHSVKPGLTGWAQVNFKYGASQEDALEKLQYDLYYIKNLSFFLDLRIILKTIRVVFFGPSSRAANYKRRA